MQFQTASALVLVFSISACGTDGGADGGTDDEPDPSDLVQPTNPGACDGSPIGALAGDYTVASHCLTEEPDSEPFGSGRVFPCHAIENPWFNVRRMVVAVPAPGRARITLDGATVDAESDPLYEDRLYRFAGDDGAQPREGTVERCTPDTLAVRVYWRTTDDAAETRWELRATRE